MMILRFVEFDLTASIDESMRWKRVEGDDPLKLLSTLNSYHGGDNYIPLDAGDWWPFRYQRAAEEARRLYGGRLRFEDAPESGDDVEVIN